MYTYLRAIAIFTWIPCILGCGFTTAQEWSENYALLEGVRATSPAMIDGNLRTMGETAFPEGSQGFSGVSPASEAVITLPEKKLIRRIVIQPRNLRTKAPLFQDLNPRWRWPLHLGKTIR